MDKGSILIDGVDIKEYELSFLRKAFGVVQQEPVLFSGTIGENIRYNLVEKSEEEVKLAARKANCLGFIEKNEEDISEKEGFERVVGSKGGQLSGGQK